MEKIFDKNGRLLGEFIPDTAGFKIKTFNLPTAWEYIYQNRDILLKVDQFGPVYAQANPPADVMLFRRENGQRFSNWTVWIKKDGEEPFNNFFRPQLNGLNCKCDPENLCITYLPEKAVYEFEHQFLKIKTEIAIPLHGKEIVMKLTVTNNGPDANLQLKPFMIPYCNEAQLAPWDKNEWYLRTGFGNEQNKGVFWTQLLNPAGDKKKRRTMVLLTELENLKNVELSYEKFIGDGSAYCPEYAVSGNLRLSAERQNRYGEYCDDSQIYAYPPVYATEYCWHLKTGETRTLTQTLSMPDNQPDGSMADKQSALKSIAWFSDDIYNRQISEVKSFYDSLFSINKVETPDKFFDYYINYWVAIQMNWVASLDRGWPSGMRGTRDSSNDYSALIYTDLKSCREVLLTMLSCQRTDGWFPRQYSAAGRMGRHDFRPYADGGVWLLELFYKYVTYSGDTDIFDVLLPWLDSDDESTVWEHIIKTMEYYIADENIGEHGLCKIRGGDWLDPIALAGLEGRGESVTITCQTIIALGYIIELCAKYKRNIDRLEIYKDFISKFKKNLCTHAINKKGWFNSVFNDNGMWVFSDRDYDGKERPYGPANWYAVSSCAVSKDKLDDVLSVMNLLSSEYGYRVYYPPFSPDQPMDKIGRSTSGDVPEFLAENGNVYNQGSQGFLARALAKAGRGNELYDVMKWMLPCYQEKHPTVDVMTAPYAITNCYQQLPVFPHRAMLSFLTGTVAMCVRGAYEWLAGVESVVEGLEISPCLPDAWDKMSLSLKYKGRTLDIRITRSGNKALAVNGINIEKSKPGDNRYREFFAVPDKLLTRDINTIEINI